MGTARKYLINN